MTFKLQVLPARHGDCIWIEYGTSSHTKRVLIDAGPTFGSEPLFSKIKALDADDRRFELMVVTHVDTDHINGFIKLLNRYSDLNLNVGDFWFNGWPQLTTLEDGPKQVASAIRNRGFPEGGYAGLKLAEIGIPWNASFGGGAAMTFDDYPLPTVNMEGGLQITLLSPTFPRLRDLQMEWTKAFKKKNVPTNDSAFLNARFKGKQYRGIDSPEGEADDPGAEPPLAAFAWGLDDAVANGSSIAFIAEYEGVRCALFADGFSAVLADGLRRFAEERKESPVKLAAVKLSHHGSKNNISDELLELIDCENFVISTDGSIFHFPDDETIKLLTGRTKALRLFFNYENERMARWSLPNGEQVQYIRSAPFDAVFPVVAEEGAVLDLLDLNSR